MVQSTGRFNSRSSQGEIWSSRLVDKTLANSRETYSGPLESDLTLAPDIESRESSPPVGYCRLCNVKHILRSTNRENPQSPSEFLSPYHEKFHCSVAMVNGSQFR